MVGGLSFGAGEGEILDLRLGSRDLRVGFQVPFRPRWRQGGSGVVWAEATSKARKGREGWVGLGGGL